MKISSKALIASTALMLASSAFAAVPVVPTPQPVTIASGGLTARSNNGPLLAVVWDAVTGSSLVQYLGLSYNDVSGPDMTVPGTVLDFGTLGGFGTTFSTAIGASQTSRLFYGVFAMDNVASSDPEGLGLRTTGSNFVSSDLGTRLSTVGDSVNRYISQVINGADACNRANPCSVSGNENSPIYFGGALYGAQLGGSLNSPETIAGNVGTALNFYDISVTAASNPDANVTQYLASTGAGQWLLTAAGALTYTVPSAVPLPAAAWLLVSGLMGFGVVRRRNAMAA